MNLEPTPEQRAMRATVRGLIGGTPNTRSLLDAETGTTAEAWKQLAAAGATGLLVPARHGGAGLGMAEAGAVLEELGAALYSGPFLSCAVAAPRAIARFGAGETAATLLAGIADGSLVVTVGDPASPVDTTGGRLTGWIVVPDAAAADVVLVPTPDGLFAVDTAGLEPVRMPGVDLTRRRFTADLREVPAVHLAGSGRAGAAPHDHLLDDLLDDLLVAHAADAVGAAGAVLRLTVDHATTRAQFGRPIGSFQAVQHLCVDMYETVELARSGLLYALWAADHAEAPERHRAAIRLKAFSGRLAAVGDTAVQVLGGLGFTWEHDAHLYLRRLLGWSTYLGRPERYLQEVGALLDHTAKHQTAEEIRRG